jgi:hypothetical protein
VGALGAHGIVDAADKTLTTGTAAPAVTGQSSPAITPPQSAAS